MYIYILKNKQTTGCPIRYQSPNSQLIFVQLYIIYTHTYIYFVYTHILHIYTNILLFFLIKFGPISRHLYTQPTSTCHVYNIQC